MNDWHDLIVRDPQILGGKPVIKGTRLSVEFVLDLLAAGWGKDELRENYPNWAHQHERTVSCQ